MTDYTWINTPEALADCVTRLRRQPFVAIDTEFFRERSYYPALGLLQIADAEGCMLIDPLELDGLADLLRPWLTDPACEKVFHSGEEDLEILGRLLGEPVQGVMDTQLIQGFVTGEASMGYARMVAERLDIEVPKDQTRSNWLQRPLSEQQCQYAVNDVTYLYRLYPAMRQALVDLDRLSWLQEDTDRLASRVLQRDDSQYYLQLRQAFELNGNRLWLLQQLAQKREERCRILDRNRKAVVSDPDLVTLAQKRPDSLDRISQVTEIRPGVLRHEGDWMLALIQASHTVDSSQYPERIQPPLPRALTDHFQSMRAVLTELAKEQGLPREYLTRKRDLERFVLERSQGHAAYVPAAWSGWRWALFGDLLSERLQQRLQISVEQED
ncbi:hypothetical protein E4656_03775 [Natronospirillum operosum]|uniref:HRDC domain-containing protein n=1 Tax=Natronospirillum operosum TaxID=2759953 RepID=A0A4Z0WID4_9GAMM|nr:HRDC domain-containing protein [Natronospirillum operosum]TGG95546.1 hypothetical protein E4656_03775 [Natronospirillum operosum]